MSDDWKKPEVNELIEEVARPEEEPDKPGLYFYGILRARAARATTRRNPDIQRVGYRDIEALVKPTTFELPDPATAVAAHQKVLEAIMQRTTVLPAPFGVVFRGRRPLIHFLQEQY